MTGLFAHCQFAQIGPPKVRLGKFMLGVFLCKMFLHVFYVKKIGRIVGGPIVPGQIVLPPNNYRKILRSFTSQ